ncbi:MAG: hypothetical protein PVI91_15520 [Gammaproteobacteria bacterium]|jgi:hypothetical protein
MNLNIRTGPPPDREQLRALLIDAADHLVGKGSSLLESKLGLDAGPILLADAGLHPVLVSFEPEDSASALLNGLRAVEQLSKALTWVNQMYPPLQHRQLPPKLVVVSGTYPPGASVTLHACPGLSLFEFRLFEVDEQTGLWLSRLDPLPAEAVAPPTVPRQPAAKLPKRASNDLLPELTEAEKAYFEQL